MNGSNLHILLRHSIPGYIFLLCAGSVSLVLFPKSLAMAVNLDGSVLLALAGIPIGTVIYWLYRSVYERFLEPRLREPLVNTFLGLFDDREVRERIDRNRVRGNLIVAVALWSEFYRNDKAKTWADWVNFQFSRMHSIGSAIPAIVLGILIPLFAHGYIKGPICLSDPPIGGLIIIWLFVVWACIRLYREARQTVEIKLEILPHILLQILGRRALDELRTVIRNLLILSDQQRTAAEPVVGED